MRPGRIFEHLRQQNWTAIGIELVIVVLGVFIGIQVSNWNEARIEQQRTALVLDTFRADLRDFLGVGTKFLDKTTEGLAAFDAARSRGERVPPYFMRVRGSDTAPRSVWEAALQSGLADLVHPSLMFDLGYYYSELDGIGVKFIRYSGFVESQILPHLDDPQAFYDDAGNLKPEYRQNMQRLREWVDDSVVLGGSARCLLARFDAPKSPAPSCRPNYGNFGGQAGAP